MAGRWVSLGLSVTPISQEFLVSVPHAVTFAVFLLTASEVAAEGTEYDRDSALQLSHAIFAGSSSSSSGIGNMLPQPAKSLVPLIDRKSGAMRSGQSTRSFPFIAYFRTSRVSFSGPKNLRT